MDVGVRVVCIVIEIVIIILGVCGHLVLVDFSSSCHHHIIISYPIGLCRPSAFGHFWQHFNFDLLLSGVLNF